MFPARRARWLFALSLLVAAAKAKRPSFSTPGLFNIDVGLANVDGIVAALGDFNADKLTDLFVLDSAQHTVTVFAWSEASYSFTPIGTPLSYDPSSPSSVTIVNIVPGDFNYDGKLDLLIMAKADPAKPDGELLLRVYYGNGVDSFASSYVDLPSATTAQPFVVDFNGTMTPDLMGYPFADSQTLSVWSPIERPHPYAANLTEAQHSQPCVFSSPHSNTFADFDGDCLADMLFTCQNAAGGLSLQIWINNKQEGFTLAIQKDLPKGAGQITVSDMDGDGTIDLVFPVCEGSTCSIHVAYNKQIPLCASASQTGCRDPHDLCVADPAFDFQFAADAETHVAITVASILGTGEHLATDAGLFKGPLPIPLRIGDYNNDGYPDLLVVTTLSDGSSKVRILESYPCASSVCSAQAVSGKRRAFQAQRSGVTALDAVDGQKLGAAFMDLNEDGTLDVLVFSVVNNVYKISALYNNYYNDAFFLKSLVLNGVCPGWCPTGEKFPSPRPYGVNYAGASFKFNVMDTSGQRRATQVAQLSQSSYLSLQTPYCLFGLGRTNNYVEDFFVGITRHQKEHFASYQGVIPNSQLIIIPYQQGDDGPSSWQLELYVNPSAAVGPCLLVLCTSLVILSTIVAVLHWLEKREDEIEKRKALHVINFDAL
ncbi:hypothetical protein BDK51DRAFT_21778 [Blyttiomyces helicus]|uniref:T-cell immunomodulatory protein TIP C2 domain-containing protein n=1 Tax=Blyttiomyces helicus TaxID=388810 RepID=A0A4P9WEL3_9FUNG|nr:hypothetical protein BDK51DRAFT_21778 [Blyttiomyces helicus]|eukprot:RKO90225.1 hypothetical protein BDK51DRAFT_21778 [Blyttiomyces helicus]